MNSNNSNGYGNAQQFPTTNQAIVGQQPPTTPMVNGQFQVFGGYDNAMPIQPVTGAQGPSFLVYDANYPNGYFDQYYNWYPMAPPPQRPQNFLDVGIDMTDVYVPLDLGNLADLPGNAEFMKYYEADSFSQAQQQQQSVAPQHQVPQLVLQAPSPVPPPVAPVFPVRMQAPLVAPQPLAPTPSPAVPAAPVNNPGFGNNLPPFANPLTNTPHPTVKVQLRDQKLWNKFYEKTNEMVVTLEGKQIFPRIAYVVTGLNSNSRYQWSIRLIRVSPYEKKWNSKKSVWQATNVQDKGKLESNELFSDVKSGEQWQKEGVNFCDKTKVANTVSDRNKEKMSVGKNKKAENENRLLVKQHYSYQPVLSLHEITENGGQMMVTQRGSYQFPETEFLVVTQYKNKEVSDMKTMYNHFNSKEKQKKATQRLNKNGVEQSGSRSGDDSGYNTTSRESTLSPKIASPEVTPFPSQYFGADGSAPSTSSQY